MKRLIPKSRIKWTEPKVIRKIMDDTEKRTHSVWTQPIFALISFCSLMLLWWVAKHNPEKTPPTFQNALLIAIGGGVLFAYGIPWIIRLCPSYIQIFDHGFMRSRGNNNAVWKFQEIDSCELKDFKHDSQNVSVLVLHLIKGNQVVIALPPEIKPKISSILVDMKVTIKIAQQ